jgi:glutaredoxin
LCNYHAIDKQRFQQTLLILMLVAISLAAGWSAQESITPRMQPPDILTLGAEAVGLVGTDRPLLLSLSTCAACGKAREWLSEHRVAYDELVIDQSETMPAVVEALGINAVPALIVRDRYLVGFHPGRMREMLALQ